MTFYGNVKNGALAFFDLKLFRKFLSSLEGKRVVIEAEEDKGKRAASFNRWYWAVCVEPVAQTTGYSKQEIHDFHKSSILKKTIVLNNKPVEIVQSTTELNDEEFSEFCERSRQLDIEWFPDCIFPSFEEYTV